MSDKINGRTPDEIKKGLGHCRNDAPCLKCTYRDRRDTKYTCEADLLSDALALIRQLESRIDTLTAKAVLFDEAVAAGGKMKSERDAAVKDLTRVVASNYYSGDFCGYCKHNEPDGQCHHRCIPYSSEWGWEWRGVQEVE